MKKTLLSLAVALLATTTNFAQQLYSELSPWQGNAYCNMIPHGSCPTFDKLCNDMTTTCPPSKQWYRIGTPSHATDAAGNDIGVLIWASNGAGNVEGIFTEFNFTPGVRYNVTVGIRSFNMPGSNDTKLRLYAGSGFVESNKIPCCDEPGIEDNAFPAPNNVDQHWLNNNGPGTANPQIEFIGDLKPSSAFSGTTKNYGASFVASMYNNQFLLHAYNSAEGQLNAVIDYVIIEESCSSTEFMYSGNTNNPYNIDFSGDYTTLPTTWTFGDGNSSNNTQYTSNMYPGPGGYNVWLTRDVHFGNCQYGRAICINDPIVNGSGDCEPPHFNYQVFPSQGFSFPPATGGTIAVTPLGNMTDLVDINFGEGPGSVIYSVNQQTSYTHTYNAPGSYQICVTSSSDPSCSVCMDICVNDDERIQTVMATDDPGEGKPTSVTSFGSANDKLQELTVVPNPANNVMTLNFTVGANDKSKVDIEMYDVAGRKVLSRQTAVKTGANAVNIDISNLNSGIYIINVRNGAHTIKSKVVKQ